MTITSDALFMHYDREANKALKTAQDLRVRGNPTAAAHAAEEAVKLLRVSELAAKLTDQEAGQVSAARDQIRRGTSARGSRNLVKFILAEHEAITLALATPIQPSRRPGKQRG